MDDSSPLIDERPGPPARAPLDTPSSTASDVPISRKVQLGLAVMALAALVFGGSLGMWVCAAILSFVALESRLIFARVVRARWTPLLLVGAIFVALCGPLLLGHPPASRDHGIHYFQAHTFVHEFLLEGQLRGWTDRVNHGLPLGDSYPMLGYFLAALFHIVSLGALSLRASYAIFMAALWAASMAATGLLSARILRSIQPDAGPHTARLAMWAGSLAGLAWCVDPGSSREGGWNYLIFHGVWPQQLSVTLWVFGLLAILNVHRQPTARRTCVAAALLGLSIIAHPFGLLATCVVIPALVLSLVIARRDPSPADDPADDPRALRFWASAGVFVLASAIAAGTVFILLQSEESMGRGPVPWKDLPTLSARMWSGEIFQSQHALVGAAAVLGVILVLRQKSLAGVLVFSTIVGIFLVGSRDALTALRLDLVVPALKNVQFLRWSVFVKPLWYAFAGVGAVVAARGIATWTRRPSDARTSRLMLCVLLGPLLAGGVVGVFDVIARPVGGLHTLEGSRYAEVDAALKDALDDARANTPDGALRVAFLRRGMSGGTYPLFALADANADIVIDGHVPAINFERRVRSQDPGLLRSLGVTHVLYDRPLDAAPKALLNALEPILERGEYTLARLRDGGGDPIAQNARFKVQSAGDIEVVVSPGKKVVRLPIAPYRKWSAIQDGTALEISPARFRRGLTGMEIHPTSSTAPVVLRYEEPSDERLFSRISIFAALLCLLGIAWGPRLPRVAWVSRAPRLRHASAAYAVGATLVVAGGLAYARQGPQLIKTWRSAAPAWEGNDDALAPRVKDLVAEGAFTLSSNNSAVCDGMKTRDAQAGCVPRRNRPHLSTLYAAPYLYRCMRVQVPAGGWVEFALPLLPEQTDLVVLGSNLPNGPRRGSLEMRTSATAPDWRPLQKISRMSVPMEDFGGQAPVVALQNVGKSPGTACVALATVTRPATTE